VSIRYGHVNNFNFPRFQLYPFEEPPVGLRDLETSLSDEIEQPIVKRKPQKFFFKGTDALVVD
jgi:hypothetical protein